MSKRRRILVTLAGILLAAYVTGPQVSVDSGQNDRPSSCAYSLPTAVYAECEKQEHLTVMNYTALRINLTNPRVQLFYADSTGTVTGFNTFGHFQ